MRVLTCASYYGTGSSAITDLLTECDNVFSLGDAEYRFLQDPGGVSDLEYWVVENNHRHNTSDGIKQFQKYMKSLKRQSYGTYDVFGDSLETLTDRYIDEITELKAHTWWNKDRLDKGDLFILVDRLYSLGKRILTGQLRSEKKFSLLKNRELAYYTTISEEDFLKATRRFVNDLLMAVNTENKPYVLVDQMVPPTNLKRYVRYFDDVRVVVVDRDPRDLYLLEKTVWQWGVIPVETAEEFVEWFRITRKHLYSDHNDAEKVLRIRFEDLVYRYEETRDQVLQFAGIDKKSHCYPKQHFDPAISIKNTNLKTKIKGYQSDIEYIEQSLGEFLYPFEV